MATWEILEAAVLVGTGGRAGRDSCRFCLAANRSVARLHNRSPARVRICCCHPSPLAHPPIFSQFRRRNNAANCPPHRLVHTHALALRCPFWFRATVGAQYHNLTSLLRGAIVFHCLSERNFGHRGRGASWRSLEGVRASVATLRRTFSTFRVRTKAGATFLTTLVNKVESIVKARSSDMDYALNVKMDYPSKTEYSDYDGSDYSGFEDSKKRKTMEGGDGTSTVKLSRDELKKLLEPLSKEQLVGLLIEAGSQFPAVADDIRDSASKDPVHRKLFVRGLAWETSSVALREAFEQYGEVEEACVITDKGTGKSRGFGFITFKHMDSAQRALKEPSKNIDGRITVCNLASAGGSSGASSSDQAQRKLYIGGLSYETTSDTLLNIFSQYGEIEEGAIAYDKNTNKSRGFAFVTFKTTEGAKRAMDDSNKTIEGRHVTVKLAAEGQRERTQPQSASAQLQSLPQVQQGYTSINPSMSNYSRPQMATSAPQTLSFSAYAPLAYGTQATYGGLVTNTQYGGLSTSPQPYNPSQYGQYATFGNQSTHTGIPTVASIQAGSLSSYYTGTN